MRPITNLTMKRRERHYVWSVASATIKHFISLGDEQK
jgi:hypothetical protein